MSTNPLEETPEAQVRRWATMFDLLAGSYDQSGVPFFGPIAAGLVERLAPTVGERVLDAGCGRGAVTLRAAELVGPTGRVDAIDIAPGMVELTAAAAAERELRQVDVRVGDASDPGLIPASYDVVASSLVAFFLPDPEAALRGWFSLLVPGGRLGIATFRPWAGAWKEIEDLFGEYAEDTGRPGPTQMPDVFDDDESVADLVSRAGGSEVRTEAATFRVPFADLEQWRVWSLGTAMRGLWLQVPEESHPEILSRVDAILTAHDHALDVDIRYTLATA
jgi:ubiquinone/menaquinone biosynthesis C-methylase UbiE